MRHDNARSLARNLALDRDGAVAGGSGGTAGIDVARLLNDHISWYGASDRSKVYGATAATFSIGSGAFSARLGLTNVLKIVAVTREASGTTVNGTPMEMSLPSDIYHERSKSTTPGTPEKVAFVRLAGDGNRMRAIVHPPPDGTYFFAVHTELAPAEFTVTAIDDAEVMDLPQMAQYGVVREVALDLCIILKRPDSTWNAVMSRVPGARELTAALAARDKDISPPRDEVK